MLHKIFNVNQPFWKSMGTVFDLFTVNALWLFFSLPIVTLGPATAAACYTVIERMLGHGGYVSTNFFRSFKKNLKQGMLLGVPASLTGAFLLFDIYLCRVSGTGIYTFFMVFFAVIFLFYCFTMLYAFPLLAKFDMKNKEILMVAFVLSIKNISMTLLMMLVISAGLWVCHLLPGLIFIMFGIVLQFCCTIIVAIFKPMLPNDLEEYPEDNFQSSIETDNDYFSEDLL